MGRPGTFQKGNAGGPGRPPKASMPMELRRQIELARNEFKAICLTELRPRMVEWVKAVIEQGVADGDMDKLKLLAEIAIGRLIEEPPEFPVNDEEKILVLEYRKRKAEHEISSVQSGIPAPRPSESGSAQLSGSPSSKQ